MTSRKPIQEEGLRQSFDRLEALLARGTRTPFPIKSDHYLMWCKNGAPMHGRSEPRPRSPWRASAPQTGLSKRPRTASPALRHNALSRTEWPDHRRKKCRTRPMPMKPIDLFSSACNLSDPIQKRVYLSFVCRPRRDKPNHRVSAFRLFPYVEREVLFQFGNDGIGQNRKDEVR